MPAETLNEVQKGHRFPPVTIEISQEWTQEYVDAVGDGAITTLTEDAVPPTGIAALCIRSLLENVGLPPGAIHLGQELSVNGAVRAGASLMVHTDVASRGERQGWVLMGLNMRVEDSGGREVLAGRATVTFPLDPDAPEGPLL